MWRFKLKVLTLEQWAIFHCSGKTQLQVLTSVLGQFHLGLSVHDVNCTGVAHAGHSKVSITTETFNDLHSAALTHL